MFIRKYFPFLFVGSALQVFSPVGVCNEPPNSYRAEAELGYSTTDGDDYDSKIVDLGFAYYLSPVSISNTPYAEAPFLERVGSVVAVYGKIDSEWDFGSGDGPLYGLGFQYAEKNLPFYFDVLYAKADQDIDSKVNSRATANIKSDTVGIDFGYYLSDDSAISFGYAQNETKGEAYNPYQFPQQETFKSESDNYSIGFKKVTLLDQNRAFNLEIEFLRSSYDDDGESGDNDEISLLADYYVNPATSFGLGFMTNSGDAESAEGDTVSLRFKVYATPAFSLEAAYDDFSAKQDNNDSRTVSFGVGARF
ncbi:MAG: hypothetical protein PVJ72_17285 [Gammaproteobacteria bacterium]|jgi:hypothetical protein